MGDKIATDALFHHDPLLSWNGFAGYWGSGKK